MDRAATGGPRRTRKGSRLRSAQRRLNVTKIIVALVILLITIAVVVSRDSRQADESASAVSQS